MIIKRQLIIGDSKISNSRGRSTSRGANILLNKSDVEEKGCDMFLPSNKQLTWARNSEKAVAAVNKMTET